MLYHPIPPVFDHTSRILILGSFPSVKSREAGFFYGHPQNRFWRVVSAIFDCPTPVSTEEKRTFLLSNHIALWDVIASCEIQGSSDKTIRNVTPNDLSVILQNAPIKQIYVNGKTAAAYYKRFSEPVTDRTAFSLPSTSPANAAFSMERLIEAWARIRDGR